MTADLPPSGESPPSDFIHSDISERPQPSGESPHYDSGDIMGQVSGGEAEEEQSPPKVKGLGRMASVMARILTEEGERPLQKLSRVRPGKKRPRRERGGEGVRSDGDSEGEEDEALRKEHRGKPPHHDVVRACHRLPEASALEEERRLQRVATRGVVQLFNAVSKQQKELEARLKGAGPSERKKSKVMASVDKGSFIDLLKGGGVQSSKAGGKKTKASKRASKGESPPQPSWNVLRDNYLQGSKLRDWDREEAEREGEGGPSREDDSSSGDDV